MTERDVEFTEGNAYVCVVVKKEAWGYKRDGYQCTPFHSAARLAGLYSQRDESLPRARRGLAREMLCQALRGLVYNEALRKSDVFVVEADESDDDQLVRKVYLPMSFKVVSKDADDDQTLMRSTIGDVLAWCDAQKVASPKRVSPKSPKRASPKSPRR